MTPRDRMLATLNFQGPDRFPRDLWLLPIASMEHGKDAIDAFKRRWPTDITQCTAGKAKPRRGSGDPYAVGTFTDEWGCAFENIQAGVIGEVKHPLLDDYAKLDDLQPPTELLNVDIAAANAFRNTTDKFLFASGWGRLFERMQFLRGTENLYMDIAEESPEFFEFLRRVHTFYRDQYQVWAKTDTDAQCLMDDWGSQRALLISPEKWRKIFKPLYAEYVEIAHGAGKKFFMHSDGFIFDIYQDLIDIGVDAINSQLFCMDIEEIGRRFAGKITFWGEIDRQHILPFGTPDDARAAVRRVHENLYRHGGVIAQFELTAGGKLPNAQAIFETWDALPTHR